MENSGTERECKFYTKAEEKLKELIEGTEGEENPGVNPRDLLKLKVTMCCQPKNGEGGARIGGEEWGLKDILSPEKDMNKKLKQCSGKCISDNDGSATNR